MNALSKLALVPFVSVDNMMKIVLEIGVEACMEKIAGYIEDDFKRWELFDKTPRIASHSKQGVIELMPTSDGKVYGFKYVNGHPKNMQEGLQTVTAFGSRGSKSMALDLASLQFTTFQAKWSWQRIRS